MLRSEIEFLSYLLSCLISVVSFVYINYVFARKSFSRITNIFIYYMSCSFMLLFMLFLPRFYILISARFPSSIFACDDAAISLVFWMFGVLPCFLILNITLFIILIIKILGPKKELKNKSNFADASSE